MKNFGILVLSALMLISVQTNTDARASKATKKLKAVSSVVTDNVGSKSAKKGLYGSSTIADESESKSDKKSKKKEEKPELVSEVDTPLDPKLVKTNQAKDNHIASGIQHYKLGNFDLAYNEFRKALSYGKKDPFINTWLQASNNSLRIDELGLDELIKKKK